MATNRKRRTQPRKAQGLTHSQREDLIYGFYLLSPPGPCYEWQVEVRVELRPFENESSRRDAWFEYREDLMNCIGAPRTYEDIGIPWGCRPRGWWDYESPGIRSKDESEFEFLKRHRLLLEGEAERVKAQAERFREKQRQNRLKKADSIE